MRRIGTPFTRSDTSRKQFFRCKNRWNGSCCGQIGSQSSCQRRHASRVRISRPCISSNVQQSTRGKRSGRWFYHSLDFGKKYYCSDESYLLPFSRNLIFLQCALRFFNSTFEDVICALRRPEDSCTEESFIESIRFFRIVFLLLIASHDFSLLKSSKFWMRFKKIIVWFLLFIRIETY